MWGNTIMMQVRLANERGYAEHGGRLKSYHTFSFANYFDRQYMQFSHLRVINEDWIAPSQGFGTHPHRDMEILTYVRAGRVAHRDSMGNITEIPAGEFQIMSAGTGIAHSEMNPSSTETLHLFQIWIMPNVGGITPRYDQGRFEDKEGATLILSPEAEDGSFKVYQDIKLWRWQLPSQDSRVIELDLNRHYWLQLIKGSITVNGITLSGSDAIGVTQEQHIEIQTDGQVEFLLFDLV